MLLTFIGKLFYIFMRCLIKRTKISNLKSEESFSSSNIFISSDRFISSMRKPELCKTKELPPLQ